MTIRETFDAFFSAAAADRDAGAWVALWAADDPTIVMWGSDLAERAEGIDAIRAFGDAITQTPTQLGFRWDDVRIHEDERVAWINAAGAIAIDGVRQPYRVTAVLRRTDDGWRWHTFNGSIPD
jgi:ketosteroid isomerase-like protein